MEGEVSEVTEPQTVTHACGCEILEGEYVCPECKRCEVHCPEWYCDPCDRFFTNCSEVTQCSGCNRCPSCHSQRAWTCSDCSMTYCGEYYDENINCSECEVCIHCSCDCEGNVVREYSTNVVDTLRATIPQGVRTFGIELEFECDTMSDRERIATEVSSNVYLYNDWICKEDGSLSRMGIEIVSRPMTLEDLKSAVIRLFDKTRITHRVYYSDRCGTHIHVGRKNVENRTIARAWAPWRFAMTHDNEPMQELLRALAGRRSNSYCEWECQSPVSLRSSNYSRHYTSHYNAISASAHFPTYEWRMFSGCTKVESALRFIETVDCLLSIAEETTGTKVLEDSNTMLVEIGKRLDRYPNLLATAQNSSRRLSLYYPTLDAAKAGVARKLRAMPSRKGIDVMGNSRRDIMKKLSRIATPPPRGNFDHLQVAEPPVQSSGFGFDVSELTDFIRDTFDRWYFESPDMSEWPEFYSQLIGRRQIILEVETRLFRRFPLLWTSHSFNSSHWDRDQRCECFNLRRDTLVQVLRENQEFRSGNNMLLSQIIVPISSER